MNKEIRGRYDVVVIGAGASGLMAAGKIAEKGFKVLLLEKMGMPARKLRITGKGRCNITNTASLSDFLKETGPDPRFLRSAFALFFNDHLMQFFPSIGVPLIEERGGRVFPQCQSAVELSEKLVNWVKKQGVDLRTNARVNKIVVENNRLSGVLLMNNEIIPASKIIIACGGKSYPATGSSGDGYQLAAQCGHTITTPHPVLVPLETAGKIASSLQGLSLKNVSVSLWHGNRKMGSEFGEMLFTHFGLSGPVILTLSRRFANEINDPVPSFISIDLKPALDEQKLDQRIVRDLNENGKKHFGNLLREYLPGKLALIAPALLSVDPSKPAHQISATERKRFRIWLKDFRFEITGHRGWAEAIITRGGVSLGEIESKNMQSKLVSGLFFCGEVLDLDANTGGYNLQIAFSTAVLAAKAVTDTI